jgi:hypothetical protein
MMSYVHYCMDVFLATTQSGKGMAGRMNANWANQAIAGLIE